MIALYVALGCGTSDRGDGRAPLRVSRIGVATSIASLDSALVGIAVPNDLAVGSGMQAFASFGESSQIGSFNLDGGAVRVVGQRGAGPGDLAEPCCIGLINDSTLLVLDPPNARVQTYRTGPEGLTFLGSVNSAAYATTAYAPLSMSAEGRLALLRADFKGETGMQQFRVDEIDSEGLIVSADTIPMLGLLSSAVKSTAGSSGSFSNSIARLHFGAEMLAALGPSGRIAYANSAGSAVMIRWAGGAGVDSITISHEPPLLNREELELVRKQLASLAQRGFRVTGAAATHKPPLAGLGFDAEGRLWVQLAVPSGGEHTADVFEVGGRRVGRFSWPANVSFPGWAIRGTRGVGIEELPGGDERIVRVDFRER